MTERFSAGRGAVVTGAAGGLGRGIAERLLTEGVQVLLVDVDPDRLGDTVVELSALGQVAAVSVDLTAPDAPATVVSAAAQNLGSIDILVNNAGIGGSTHVHEVEEQRWRDVIELNLHASFRLTRAVLPDMMRREYGRIVNIASMNGMTGFRRSSDYAVSKAGLIALTRSLAADYGRHGITANAVAPGVVMTPLAERMLASRPQWYTRANIELKPIARTGETADVAAAVAYLASDEAGYVTGQTLAVDGGLTATHYVPDQFSDER
ncbi:SDR family NAD(P)-dependent oxidoreductase [Aeromicrobium chenweiae]|uniref:Short-chain dehydrogenase n=1 Tax=Aeromicrobium chenweiae TaxID=2079793 RepID=A0A2S0WPF7_9ACTN|nr:SDR family NAD(P)-dependent oxidoreductase [Aeromicrobium chenweiae]AWB93233.1 short-chain dehydrogenase [Aeromicrobium chenweiae]TGN34226.1 SDR family oxidoreductase [Aeromicrobium chenweiae]